MCCVYVDGCYYRIHSGLPTYKTRYNEIKGTVYMYVLIKVKQFVTNWVKHKLSALCNYSTSASEIILSVIVGILGGKVCLMQGC